MLGGDATTSVAIPGSVSAVVLATFLVNGLGDTADQALGHMILAVVGNDNSKLRLELDGSATGSAEVQVLGNLNSLLVGQLTVEVVVELMHRLVTVHRHP